MNSRLLRLSLFAVMLGLALTASAQGESGVRGPNKKKPTTTAPKPSGTNNSKKPTTTTQNSKNQNRVKIVFNSSTNTITYGEHSYKMVYVAGGTFTMGATSEQGEDADWDEKPAHKVTLSSYYIGQTEVPQWLWKAVIGFNPSGYKGDNLPVESVSWNDCQIFIRKLNSLTKKNFELPTEAQWEFAARGGNSSRSYMYSGSNNIGDVAWYYGKKSHKVGTKKPNELGLYDMSGNVYEWCHDYYGSYSESHQINPKGANNGDFRVRRGGSWHNELDYFCRISERDDHSPDIRLSNVGLRLAMNP